MASFQINIPDAQVGRLVQAVAKIRGVDISAMTVPQRIQFIKSDLRDYWIDLMAQVEVPAVTATAAETARVSKLAEINANLTVS